MHGIPGFNFLHLMLGVRFALVAFIPVSLCSWEAASLPLGSFVAEWESQREGSQRLQKKEAEDSLLRKELGALLPQTAVLRPQECCLVLSPGTPGGR